MLRSILAKVAPLGVAAALCFLFFRPAGFDFTSTFLDAVGFEGVPGLSMALDAQALHTESLMARPGVVGTAVAIGPDGRAALMVLTANPLAQALPAMLSGTPVLTQVTGRFVAGEGYAAAESASPNPAASFPRPVPIGVSAGQVSVTAGTIGARVVSGSDVFALSNNHVFANRNQAKKGDAILQPGRVDGGSAPKDAIGTLHDFEPIRFCTSTISCPSNKIDAAIASTSTDDLGTATPSNGYGIPKAKPAAARLGMSVQKFGRTTGHTKGQITGINATIDVGFGNGVARFTGQIVIGGGGFSAPGDSGSLIVTDGSGRADKRPVGLLFAGSQTTTLANPIDWVLDRFSITIDDREN